MHVNRLVSLDLFRGLTIAGMLLVNNPGSWDYIYAPLKHSEWHGCTPTDWIFPFFLFMVGISIPYSVTGKLDKFRRSKVFRQILKRSVTLFCLGLFLNSLATVFSDRLTLDLGKIFTELRIPGVLQRIAVCYFFTACTVLYLPFRWHSVISVLLLVIYWHVMKFVPFPVTETGTTVWVTGILDKGKNFAAYLDSIFLSGHMWKVTKTWDPEGILSTVPAIAQTFFGTLTGYWLQRENKTVTDKLIGMFLFGTIGLGLGYILNFWLPINKSLWTSSYTIYTTGISLLFLAVCYWLTEIKKFHGKILTPFLVFGTNAILVYVLASIFSQIIRFIKIELTPDNFISLKSYIFTYLLSPILPVIDASLVYAILYVLVWLGIMYGFYKNRVYVKI